MSAGMARQTPAILMPRRADNRFGGSVMRVLQLRRLALLGSTAAGMAAALAGMPHAADAVAGSSQLLDPAYVAKQVCGAVQRKAEFFKPGALIAVAQAAAG